MKNFAKVIITATMALTITLAGIRTVKAQNHSSGTLSFIFKPEGHFTQFAVWVEDDSGQYIATTFLTDFIGRRGGGNHISSPNIDQGDGNRLSALPIWAYSRNIVDTTFGFDNYYPPEWTKPSYPDDIDAVSTATPPASLQQKNWHVADLADGRYTCWIEANKSFDDNQYHNYSWYRGQPSVAWKATVQITANPDSDAVLDYCGYGTVDGSDGSIHDPDSTITTAADLLTDMGGYRFKVTYTPDAAGVKDELSNASRIERFTLEQNYPNPFNPATRIAYSVPVADFISIKIFDALGKEVATLVNSFQSAGCHSVLFDARTLASGVYFYTMRSTRGGMEIKKMIVMH